MSFVKENFRCECPITSALDVLGDKWTLVIIKLMLLEQKKTFKEFSESVESIAPSILSSRLKTLEKNGFTLKVNLPNNKKTNYYILTEKGLSLAPVLIELALWSHHNTRASDYQELINMKDKDKLQRSIVRKYKSKTVTL